MALASLVGAGFGLAKTFLGGKPHKINKTAIKNAPKDAVSLFQDAAFNGPSKTVKPGTGMTWLGKHGATSRDEISSLIVPPGLMVTVYNSKNGGPNKTFRKSTRYVGDKFNDHIDTVKVEVDPSYSPPSSPSTQQERANASAASAGQAEAGLEGLLNVKNAVLAAVALLIFYLLNQ